MAWLRALPLYQTAHFAWGIPVLGDLAWVFAVSGLLLDLLSLGRAIGRSRGGTQAGFARYSIFCYFCFVACAPMPVLGDFLNLSQWLGSVVDWLAVRLIFLTLQVWVPALLLKNRDPAPGPPSQAAERLKISVR